MKLFSRGASTAALLMLFPLILSVSNCGKDNTNTVGAPFGAVVTVLPDTFSITGIAAPTTVNFTVTVTNENGDPIPTAALIISGPLAVPRTPARYQFCYYPDGVTPVDSGFYAQTNDYGVYRFSIVVYGPDNVFTDVVHIESGAAFDTISLTSS